MELLLLLSNLPCLEQEEKSCSQKVFCVTDWFEISKFPTLVNVNFYISIGMFLSSISCVFNLVDKRNSYWQLIHLVADRDLLGCLHLYLSCASATWLSEGFNTGKYCIYEFMI